MRLRALCIGFVLVGCSLEHGTAPMWTFDDAPGAPPVDGALTERPTGAGRHDVDGHLLVWPAASAASTMRAHASASGSSGAGKPEISARMALVVLAQLIDLYMLIVLGAVIISWLKLPPTNTVAIVLHRLTEPALGPIRRVLPQVGGLDFSPLVLLIAL